MKFELASVWFETSAPQRYDRVAARGVRGAQIWHALRPAGTDIGGAGGFGIDIEFDLIEMLGEGFI